MTQERISKVEAWLREFFRDFGNLAVAVSSMGRFKATKENSEGTDDTKEALEEKPQRTLHPSMIQPREGDFFFPVHNKDKQ